MIGSILQAVFIKPWPFWAGGIIIGLIVPLLYYYFNTALGVSTGYGNLVKIAIPPARKLQWIKKDFAETVSWRVYFIVGIILGGFLAALLSGNLALNLTMGRFTTLVSWPALLKAIWFFCGGLLLGLGARIAGGCTSGHSIHGIANLHLSSVLVTIFFLLGGILAANLVRALMMGGLW